MSVANINWYALTPDDRKAFPKCVKPESLRGICYNRLPNDRCGGQCECVKTAKAWGLRRDMLMSLRAMKRHIDIMITELGDDDE